MCLDTQFSLLLHPWFEKKKNAIQKWISEKGQEADPSLSLAKAKKVSDSTVEIIVVWGQRHIFLVLFIIE